MPYDYELFVSYRRSPTTGQWVKNHLIPRLSDRLQEVSPTTVRICCDFQIESGSRWPDRLKQGLQNSQILLAVWSADYFRSSWCMAEWRSFREREHALGLFSALQPQGLVYPIRYADGSHFHPEAGIAQCNKDFTRLNYPDEIFRSSPKYLEFDLLIQEMAEEIVDRLQVVPPWQPGFPIIEPEPLPAATMPRPVL